MNALVLATLAAALMALPAQTPSAPPPADAKKGSDRPLTLNGCVSRSRAPQDPFTLSETGTGAEYRLTGKRLGKYVGRRVEVVGVTLGGRLTIRGGLLPSPNVAAQAGAMDPAKAAIANMTGATAGSEGSVVLPEFRVARVRALDGSCR